MRRTMVTLVAMALGLGCSHATPKTEAPVAAAPAPRPASPPPPRQDVEEHTQASNSEGNVIYFDLDSSLIKDDARPVLRRVGDELRHSKRSIRIEGNCDERGTTEYNLALGDRRAREARSYLERLGVPQQRISIVSYGSERPVDTGHDESAWAKNRRDDFKVQ